MIEKRKEIRIENDFETIALSLCYVLSRPGHEERRQTETCSQFFGVCLKEKMYIHRNEEKKNNNKERRIELVASRNTSSTFSCL